MSTIRTLGSPSASTVASDIAVGSRGSLRVASSNQTANSRNGSSASVKSPLNPCSIGTDSDILRSIRSGCLAKLLGATPVIEERHADRIWWCCRRWTWQFALALTGGPQSLVPLDTTLARRRALPAMRLGQAQA